MNIKERITLTKKYNFSAAHRLYVEKFSKEDNLKIFQKCANINGHGHNYDVEITVKGITSEDTGRIVNTELLDEHVNNIIKDLDHARLDTEIEYFQDKQSTGENIAIYFYNCLAGCDELDIVKVKVWENSSSYFEHFKEEEHNELS